MSKQKRAPKCSCRFSYVHDLSCPRSNHSALNRAKFILNHKPTYKPSPIHVKGIGMVFER